MCGLVFKIIFVILLFSAVSTQEATNYSYDFPAELGEKPETSNAERSKLDYSELPSYYEHFHPIGWSKEGNFAALFWSNSEFGWSWIVQVVNLENDESLFVDHRNSETPPSINKEQVKAKWERNSQLINENLNKHLIIPQTEYKLEKFPYTFQTDSGAVTYDIRVRNTQDTTVTSREIITKSETFLQMKFDGKAYSKRILSDTSVYAWNFYCEGFLKSPYENRITVLMVIEHPGQHFSEPNSSIGYMITGARLDSRFKLKK
jgi:hypothetical protein